MDENMVIVGPNKPIGRYVAAALSIGRTFNSIIFAARGRTIGRAVDVSEIFIKAAPNWLIAFRDTGTEDYDGWPVSFIRITATRKHEEPAGILYKM